QELGDRLWRHVANLALPRSAVPALVIAAIAFGWSVWKYPDLRIGDVQTGVPELKPDSRYNQDSAEIARNFFIGVDVLKVIAQVPQYGCVQKPLMETIDNYAWHIQNTPGVASVLSLPQVARFLNEGLSEGAPKWLVLPRNRAALSETTHAVPSTAGLQNLDCSAMPVQIYTTDHKAETISRIVAATKAYNQEHQDEGVNFALASGNVGVMAATNEEIKRTELTVIIWVHLTLLIFVLISFRSFAAVICIITPLVLCSLLTYGGMATLDIGMKSATLPVAAFGVGIGVDAGIYIWSVIARYLEEGYGLRDAYFEALRRTGKAALFTSLSLIVAVFTWLFSDLQFQRDMGALLLFMFTTNLFGAILLLPALAWVVLPRSGGNAAAPAAV
ncbi:MAG TPA: efflux RND transporter permease subunit, partial [Nevskiaceae bacterium]|nr:efflux RND transporter permease subunit [Nevskiaceae bacterium]